MSPIPTSVTDSFHVIANKGAVFDSEDSPSDRYYGFLADVENIIVGKGQPAQWSVYFELVPFEWMEAAVLSQKAEQRRSPPSGPATLLVLDDATPTAVAEALGTTVDQVVSGEWYLITLGKGIDAQRAPLSPSPKAARIRITARKVERRKARDLDKRFRARGRFSVAKVALMLAAMQPREIGIMDVGQASCNFIYDDTGLQQCYVDVGLPLFPNNPSRPPPGGGGTVGVLNPGPCLHNNPSVILTHFHWDHYAMAVQSANAVALCNRNWIIPPQVMGPVAAIVVAAVNASAAGQAHVFPVALLGLVAGYLTLVQCVPAPGMPAGNLNNTGLAVLMNLAPGLPDRALLPGDAAYQAIPGLGAVANLQWLVASHHGSDTDLIPLPPALPPIPAPQVANQGRIAYSYGINGLVPGGAHCYGHPAPAAVAAYIAAGWGVGAHVACTAETAPNSGVAGRGNIMMCTYVAPQPCGVPNCPFHVFPKQLV